MRTFAVVPTYNEAKTVIDVLDRLVGLVDEILIINDCSQDESEELVLAWLARGRPAELISFQQNQGYDRVILSGYALVEAKLRAGKIRSDDIIITIDADSQHKPEDIPRLVRALVENHLDGVRARRRLDDYPQIKQLGNKFISLALSPWAGTRLHDAHCGYLLLRAWTVPKLLDYVTGYKYSTSPEIAVVLPRVGYRVSDEIYVDSPCPRSHTKFRDAFLDFLFCPLAFFKVELALKSKRRPLPAIARQVRGDREQAA